MTDDWLQRELGQHLTPVKAPEELRVRLGFAPAKRRELPRLVLSVAAAVVMMAGGLAANREARTGGAVEFVAADPAAVSVWVAHEAGTSREQNVRQALDTGCNVCHSL